MRYEGIIQIWKDDKGFGFIRPNAGGKDVFLHISAVQRDGRRPTVGDAVEFSVLTEADGRVRANHVRFAGATDVRVSARNEGSWGHPFPYFLFLFCFGTSGYFMAATSYPTVLIYPVMGMITYATYAQDKALAQEKAFRIPESRLHLLELLGGWGGAYLAQERLRHKTVKASYQTVFWLIVCIHCLGWAYWLYTTMSGGKPWAG